LRRSLCGEENSIAEKRREKGRSTGKEKEGKKGRKKNTPLILPPPETKQIHGYGLCYALWRAQSAKTAPPLLLLLMYRTCICLYRN